MENKVIIIGHPRCGSAYMAELFSSFGRDVKHEQWGENGISSWLFAVDFCDLRKLKANYAPYGPSRPENVDPMHIIHYVRDPFNALPSITGENEFMDSYLYRKRILQNKYGVNLDQYNTMDKAAISFLLWNKMVEEQHPGMVIRAENATEPVKEYLTKMGWGVKQVTPFPDRKNNWRPRINVDWTTLRPDLLDALDKWCYEYGYSELSIQIKNLSVPRQIQRQEQPRSQPRSQPQLRTRPQPQQKPQQKPQPQKPHSNILKPRTRNGPQTSEREDNSDIIIQPRLQHNISIDVNMNTPATPRHNIRLNNGFSIRSQPKKKW